jgi:hypothetical protein
MLGCNGMASKINSNLYREAPSSFFIPPKHNDPCNEVQNKNYKQKKKDQKMQVVERERERLSYYLQTLYLGSNRGYLILNNGDSCLQAYKTFVIQ